MASVRYLVFFLLLFFAPSRPRAVMVSGGAFALASPEFARCVLIRGGARRGLRPPFHFPPPTFQLHIGYFLTLE